MEVGRDFSVGKSVTEEEAEELCWLVLRRWIGNDQYKRDLAASGMTVRDYARGLVESEEFAEKFKLRLLNYPGLDREFSLNNAVKEEEIEELFRIILRRPVGNDQFKRDMAASGMTVREYARELFESEEFAEKFTLQLLATRIGDGTLRESLLQDQKTIEGISDFRFPPIPALIPPLGIDSRKRVAVLIRTHTVTDDKFRDLWLDLNQAGRQFDVFPLVDSTQRVADYDQVIWHSEEECPSLGLYQKACGSLLWLCGDFPLYFAAYQQPSYHWYIMIEYDVHFSQDATKFLNQLCELFFAPEEQMPDGIGLTFSGPTLSPMDVTTQWPFFKAAANVFRNVYWSYFPFIALSRRAILHLFAHRQLEAARQTPPDKIVHCEAFVPSTLIASGFTFSDLNNFFPGAYQHETIGFNHRSPERLTGLPLSYARQKPDSSVAMIHAVYSQRGFLERNFCERAGNKAELEQYINFISGTYSPWLDANLVQEYISRAGIQMNSL